MKRVICCVMGLVIAASVAAVGVADDGADEAGLADLSTRSGSDWAGFGGPRGDFSSPETGIRTDWTGGKLPVVWELEIGEGYVPPAVAMGRCFVFDRVGGSMRLRCVNAQTGEKLWALEYATGYVDSYNYDGGPRSAPVVDADRVYVVGPEGMLHCVGAGDGRVRWKVDTAKEYGVVANFFGAGSTPRVEGDVLIVQVGGSPAGSEPIGSGHTQPNGSCVVGFDKRTGAVRYKVGDDLASYASPVVATVGGKRVGLMFARGGLLAFDPASGAERWRFPWRSRVIESVNAADPVVVGDEVLITECYGPGGVMLDIGGAEPRVVWSDEERATRNKAMAAHWMTPVYHEGFVYGSSGRHEYSAELRCVDWKSGQVKWSEPKLGRCSMLRVDGHLIVLGERGTMTLVRLNAAKYDVVTSLTPVDAGGESRLRYPAWAAPVLARGLLYVRGHGRMMCFELIPAAKK